MSEIKFLPTLWVGAKQDLFHSKEERCVCIGEGSGMVGGGQGGLEFYLFFFFFLAIMALTIENCDACVVTS